MGKPKPSKQSKDDDYTPTSLPPDHFLVQLGIPKGSNNFLCIDTDGTERLVEIGNKIRKQVLATRGDYAIVKLFAKGPEGKDEKPGSLAGEVVFVAADKDVKVWKKAGEWPEGFGEALKPAPVETSDVEEEEEASEDEDQVESTTSTS